MSADTHAPYVPGQPDNGPHPPAPTDAPAARGMLSTIIILLVVGAIIAAITYNAYHDTPSDAPKVEQTPPVPSN